MQITVLNLITSEPSSLPVDRQRSDFLSAELGYLVSLTEFNNIHSVDLHN